MTPGCFKGKILVLSYVLTVYIIIYCGLLWFSGYEIIAERMPSEPGRCHTPQSKKFGEFDLFEIENVAMYNAILHNILLYYTELWAAYETNKMKL